MWSAVHLRGYISMKKCSSDNATDNKNDELSLLLAYLNNNHSKKEKILSYLHYFLNYTAILLDM
jgi:hypothetical protein